MIILQMLNNLRMHGIISHSKEQHQILLKQNKQLINEIREMKSKLSPETYAIANVLYRKIILLYIKTI